MKSSYAVRLLSVMTFSNFFMFSSRETSDLYMSSVVSSGIFTSLNHVRRHWTLGSGNTFWMACVICR